MSVLVCDDPKFVWGVPAEMKPLRGFPPGRVRLRLRQKACGEVFVLTPSGVRWFRLGACGDCWVPMYELGRNHRP